VINVSGFFCQIERLLVALVFSPGTCRRTARNNRIKRFVIIPETIWNTASATFIYHPRQPLRWNNYTPWAKKWCILFYDDVAKYKRAFYRAAQNANGVYRWEFCLPVCLSVCQTCELWQNGRKIIPDFYTIRKII